MRILKSNEYVGESSSVKVLQRDPQFDYPEHSHDFSELVLVSAGSGIHIVNGEHSVILPNTIACVSDHDYHQYIDNKDVSLLNILYSKQCLSVSTEASDVIKLLESNHSHMLLNQNAFQHLDYIARQMWLEQKSDARHSQMMVSLLFETLLLYLDRFVRNKHQNSPVMQAIMYLCNNYKDQDLSVSYICEIFQVSQKKLNTQLMQLTGMSTNRFINQLRIRKAMTLLQMEWSVTEVAYHVGYNDSNYFSTKFKNITGQSPRSYVRKTNFYD